MSNTADTHAELHGSTDAMRDRIKAFIFPNVPKTEEEVEAFEKAVAYQIEHEKSIRDALEVDDVNLPNGVSSFHIGNFSMTFGDEGYKNNAVLTKETICPVAYSVLLNAGLLYKGVMGGCCSCL